MIFKMRRPKEGFNPIIMVIATISTILFYLVKDSLNIHWKFDTCYLDLAINLSTALLFLWGGCGFIFD